MSELNRVMTVVGFGVIGYFVGAFTIGYMFYPKEHIYGSRAVVEAHDTPGRKVALAPVHAGWIVRNLYLTDRWGCSPGEALQRVQDGTKITATKQGVEILVTNRFKEDARDIAEEAARLFRSMDREAELGAEKPVLPLPSEEKEKISDEIHFLKFMLEKDADSAGIADFEKVETMASQGAAGAAKLLASEDFKRRWERYRELSKMIDEGVEKEEAGQPPRLLVKPEVGLRPLNVQPPILAGGTIGVLSGVGLGFWLSMRAPKRRIGDGDAESETDSGEGASQEDFASREEPPAARPGSAESDW